MHSSNPDRPLEPTEALRLADALRAVLEIVRRRMGGPSLWSATWDSQAAGDIAATEALPCADGSAWGKNPASTMQTVAGALVETVIDHVDAVQFMLLRAGQLMLPIETQTRAASEAAAQAWWLLDPRLSPRTRMARLYILRRGSGTWLEHTLGNMGIATSSAYGNLPADLDDYYETRHGLTADRKPNGNWIGSEGERPLGFTDLVAAFHAATRQNPAKALYSYYSGAPHAMFWRTAQKYREVTDAAGRSVQVAWAPAAVFYAAVTGCVEALWRPAHRAFTYLGRSAAANELITTVRSLSATALKP